MVARSAIGSSAGAEFEFAQGEMSKELVPFGLGRFAVLGRWSQRPALAEKRAVGADEFGLEYGQVGLGGVDAFVAEDLGGDVHGEPTGHGLGSEHSAEVVCGVSQRRAGGVGEAGAREGVVEEPLGGRGADGLAAPAEAALEQVRQHGPGGAFVWVVARHQGHASGVVADPGHDGGQHAGQFRADQQKSFGVGLGRHDL